MRGGFPLFRFRGIKVLVHWTFLLLPAYIAFSGLMDGTSGREVLVEVGLVLIVFVCVVLHEFGHALTAQHYGIGTRDITLLPIGGVASLERMPEDPRQEFWITLAGPLVNLVIAGLAFLLIALSGITLLVSDLFNDLTSWHTVLSFLFAANMGLFLFNLVPAFPMDGGRILRSLLSMRLPRERATRIATTIGRVLAVGFVAYGALNGAPFLAIIGIFIFMAAGAEARQVQQKAYFRSLHVRDRMRTDPITMAPTSSVQDAWNAMTLVDHRVVLLMDRGTYFGLVRREDLRSALASGEGGRSIADMAQRMSFVGKDDPAFPLFQRMVMDGTQVHPVVEAGTIIGTIERSDLEAAFGPPQKS